MSKQLYVLIDGVWVETGGTPGPPGTAAGETAMAKFSTYYSFPSIVNGSGGKLDAAASAAAVFAAYDDVIFGSTPTDPIFDPGHTDYANTTKICALLKDVYDTRVWGYLDTEEVAGNSLAEFVVKVDKWKATGAVGIFLDKFGFDYGANDRTRQNALVDAVHNAGLPVIVNVWNIDDALNPDYGQVKITKGDVLYLESFTANTEAYLAAGAEGYATLSDMKLRMDKATGYKSDYGFDIWCSNIVTRTGLSDADRTAFIQQCEALARIFRADGLSIDSGYYSSAYGDSGKVDPFTYYYELHQPINWAAGWEMSANWHAVMANDIGLEAHHYNGEGYYVITRAPQGGGSGVDVIDDLSDVTTAGALHGDTLTKVGDFWKPFAPTTQVFIRPEGDEPPNTEGALWVVEPGRVQPDTLAPIVQSIPGLVAYYPLDETYRGTDVKGGHNASYIGSDVVFSPEGATFNGSKTCYLEIPDSDVFSVPTTGSLSIVVFQSVAEWEDGGNGDMGFVHWMGKGEENTHEWVFRHYFSPDTSGETDPRDKRHSFYHFNNVGGLGTGSYVQDPDDANLERMFVGQVTGTSANGGYTRIWKNGIMRDQDPLSNYNITPQNSTAPLRIGTRDMLSMFRGTIRRVMFFNRLLTEAEINLLYNNRGLPDGNWSAGAPVTSTFYNVVKDNFDTTFSPIWTNNNSATIVGGEAHIATQEIFGARISTGHSYTLRGSSVSFKAVPPVDPTGGDPANTWLRARINSSVDQVNEMLDFIIRPVAGTIAFRLMHESLDTVPLSGVALLPYDPVQHLYLRFRESAGKVYWETSPDALTWTARRTNRTPSWLGADPNQRLYIDAIKQGTTLQTYAVVDSVNNVLNPPIGPSPLRIGDSKVWKDIVHGDGAGGGGDYLPLTGGTVTGDLNVNSVAPAGHRAELKIIGNAPYGYNDASLHAYPQTEGNYAGFAAWAIDGDTPAAVVEAVGGQVTVMGENLVLVSKQPVVLTGSYNNLTTPQRVEGVANPVNPNDAANKQYVDSMPSGGLDQTTADGRYVNVTGDTMSGRLVASEVETRNVRNDGLMLYPWGDASAQGGLIPVVNGVPQTYSGLLFYGNQWHSGTSIVLPADPTAALESASKQYVDSKQATATFLPSDVGLLTWSYDTAAALNSGALTGGVLYLTKVKIPVAATVTDIVVGIGVAGITLTAGQNWAALYDINGVQVGITADQTTPWQTVQNVIMPLTTPYAAAAGYYYVGLLANGTTKPAFARGSGNQAVNLGLSGANARFATYSTGLTTPPASVVKANMQTAALALWVGLR